MDPVFWRQMLYLVIAIIVGYIVARVLGIGVNRAVDRTIERWVDRTRFGKSLRSLEIDLSDTVELYTALFIFLIFLYWGVQQVTVLTHPWWGALVNLVNYSIKVVLGFAFITVALLFAVFLGDYFGRLTEGYRSDVAELLKLFLVIGLIWVVVRSALEIMGLGGAMISDLMNGFVAFALGWVLADTIGDKLLQESKEFEKFAPYGKYIIFLIFTLVGLNAVFAQYLSTGIIQVLAWGVVFLFAALLVPLIVKAVKEL